MAECGRVHRDAVMDDGDGGSRNSEDFQLLPEESVHCRVDAVGR